MSGATSNRRADRRAGRAARRYGVGGAVLEVEVVLDRGLFRARIAGREWVDDVHVIRTLPSGAELVVTHDGGRARAVVVRDGDSVLVALRGRTWRFADASHRPEAPGPADASLEPFVTSPMTGVVRKVLAEPGRAFAAGETLAVIEAMKMEFAVDAPRAVVVGEVRAKPGDRVEIGDVLAVFREGGAA